MVLQDMTAAATECTSKFYMQLADLYCVLLALRSFAEARSRVDQTGFWEMKGKARLTKPRLKYQQEKSKSTT